MNTMTPVSRNAILTWTMGLTLLTGAAYGQVPSTNDTSDGNGNTGMGSAALGGPTPLALTGTDNTASGDQALLSNTTGDNNTASGGDALQNNTTGNDNTASGWDALNRNTTGSDTSKNRPSCTVT